MPLPASSIPYVTTTSLKILSDIDMGAYKVKTNHITESTPGHGVVADVSLSGVKVFVVASASDTLRASDDAEVPCTALYTTYQLLKTITVPPGYSPGSIIRLKVDAKCDGGAMLAKILSSLGTILKNSFVDAANSTYVTFSADFALSSTEMPTTLKLWGSQNGTGTGYYKNFRVYCDDALISGNW